MPAGLTSPINYGRKFGSAIGGNFNTVTDPPNYQKTSSALDHALQPFFPKYGEKVSMF